MYTSFKGISLLKGSNVIHAVYLVCAAFCIVLVATPCRGQNEPRRTLPKVLMIEFHRLTPYDTGLYKAIRAQLSAVPLTLDRIGLADEESITVDPLGSASRLARENHASMVFWIDDKETCNMFFFIPDPDGGRINSRTLDLDLSSQSSRFEVIAIAVASMVEGLLISHHIKPVPHTPKQNQEAVPSVEKEKEVKRRKWLEISLGYAGSLFTTGALMNGGRLGLGVLPIDRLAVAISVALYIPLTLEDEGLRLEIISREIEISTAGRLLLNPIDFRLGMCWSIDLRSHSVTSLPEGLEALSDADGFKGVHSLSPFISLGWVYKERIGLFGRVGVNFALNDTEYEVEVEVEVELSDSTTVMVAPFVAKLTYQLGMIVFL